MCKENLKVTREADERALANPRRSLLEKKLKTFITDVGLAEIDFATYCAFHIVHPSLPSIERTHILCLKVEVDSLKSNNPLREQIRFVEYRVMDEREFPRAYLTRMDSLIDVRFRVALSGCWKGDASASLPGAEVLEVCIINTFGTTRLPQASTREYEAVIADWFPFLQKSLESPPLSFRHLFDVKVDEAILSFDFGERAEQEAGLPSRNSPLYRQSRDAMFRSDQRARNMKRQEQSIPLNEVVTEVTGSSIYDVVTMLLSDPDAVKSFVLVDEGDDFLQKEKEQFKRQRKEDKRKVKESTSKEGQGVGPTETGLGRVRDVSLNDVEEE